MHEEERQVRVRSSRFSVRSRGQSFTLVFRDENMMVGRQPEVGAVGSQIVIVMRYASGS
jgi:hypothetical protein